MGFVRALTTEEERGVDTNAVGSKRAPRIVAAPGREGELCRGQILLQGEDKVDLPVAERFRLLRANIERNNLGKRNDRLIAVTSAVPEEGKSLTSVNLARAFSACPTGPTLLIDCDLRKPSVHHFFGFDVAPGLSDALISQRPISSFARRVTTGLHVVTAGTTIPDPAQLFDQPELMKELQELLSQYSYVILDCPPVLLCSEPLKLNAIADGTLLVVRGWQTEKRLVRDAVDVLDREKIMGVVMNDGSDSSRQYRYYRYYGYAEKNDTPRQTMNISRSSKILRRALKKFDKRFPIDRKDNS